MQVHLHSVQLDLPQDYTHVHYMFVPSSLPEHLADSAFHFPSWYDKEVVAINSIHVARVLKLTLTSSCFSRKALPMFT